MNDDRNATKGAGNPNTQIQGGSWESVFLSGLIPGAVCAWAKTHIASPCWILVAGLAYSVCIANANFRYGVAQKAAAIVIMLVIGTQWRSILRLAGQ